MSDADKPKMPLEYEDRRKGQPNRGVLSLALAILSLVLLIQPVLAASRGRPSFDEGIAIGATCFIATVVALAALCISLISTIRDRAITRFHLFARIVLALAVALLITVNLFALKYPSGAGGLRG